MGVNRGKGNMYGGVDTITCLHGGCLYDCGYCSTMKIGEVYPATMAAYSGEVRFNEKDANANLGKGHTYFVANTRDLFAQNVRTEIINRVLALCNRYPDNTYMFQSKNPMRMAEAWNFPPSTKLGTTIETDDELLIRAWSKAPLPKERMMGMRQVRLAHPSIQTYVTVEPIMRFDLGVFSRLLMDCQPDWVYIGADSKCCGLTEPTADDVQQLITALEINNIPVKLKSNLERLKPSVTHLEGGRQ